MENNKSFAWSQGLLMTLLTVCGSLTIGLVLPINLNTLYQSRQNQNIEPKNITAQAQTQKRIQQFETAMLGSWQKVAVAKGVWQSVPQSFQGQTLDHAQLAPTQKAIALTFDDGPWPGYTAQILDILKKNDIKATFFVVGRMLQAYPDVGKRIVNDGHVIGNHTWHHWYHFFNTQAAAFEIDNTSDLIYEVTGTKTTLFRPPGGMLHNGLAAYAKNKKYTVVMWSVDSVDFSLPSPPTLVNRVMKQSKPGAIVLLHDGGGNRTRTIAALPSMIEKLKKQGYQFVTVPELLQMQEKQKKSVTAKKPQPQVINN